MPRHDPIPTSRAPDFERASLAWARYKRMMRWMVLVAIACILLSILYLKSSGGPVPVHMMIATAAGVGFTILVGTGLMGLVFLSSRSGHDEEAGAKRGEDSE